MCTAVNLDGIILKGSSLWFGDVRGGGGRGLTSVFLEGRMRLLIRWRRTMSAFGGSVRGLRISKLTMFVKSFERSFQLLPICFANCNEGW